MQRACELVLRWVENRFLSLVFIRRQWSASNCQSALSQSEEISSDFCCFYGGGIRHNEDIMHSFQNFIVRLIPNHPPPLETRIWKLVVRALLSVSFKEKIHKGFYSWAITENRHSRCRRHVRNRLKSYIQASHVVGTSSINEESNWHVWFRFWYRFFFVAICWQLRMFRTNDSKKQNLIKAVFHFSRIVSQRGVSHCFVNIPAELMIWTQ